MVLAPWRVREAIFARVPGAGRRVGVVDYGVVELPARQVGRIGKEFRARGAVRESFAAKVAVGEVFEVQAIVIAQQGECVLPEGSVDGRVQQGSLWLRGP
jgi:hypothetical protein